MSNYRIVCNGVGVIWEGDKLSDAKKELARGQPPRLGTCHHCRIQRNEAVDCESVGEWSQLSPVTGRWDIV